MVGSISRARTRRAGIAARTSALRRTGSSSSGKLSDPYRPARRSRTSPRAVRLVLGLARMRKSRGAISGPRFSSSAPAAARTRSFASPSSGRGDRFSCPGSRHAPGSPGRGGWPPPARTSAFGSFGAATGRPRRVPCSPRRLRRASPRPAGSPDGVSRDQGPSCASAGMSPPRVTQPREGPQHREPHSAVTVLEQRDQVGIARGIRIPISPSAVAASTYPRVGVLEGRDQRGDRFPGPARACTGPPGPPSPRAPRFGHGRA